MTSIILFRDLGNLFERKKKLMSISESSSIRIIGITDLFLKHQFGHSSQNKLFNINYNPKEGVLLIEADSKIWANELSLRLTELYNQFKNQEIKLNKILIR